MDATTTTPAPAGSGAAEAGEQPVPPVVAVVVTCDAGWWLEDCLASLAQQDYPQLSVLVVDADSAEDPTARIAAVMPNAYVRRTRRRRGFGTAANEVLGIVEGASHFLFCHDDVVLSPHAIRLMVEEALRSNAGVVAPKLVGWFHPDRLLAVGMGADAFGVSVALAERGDLDQSQHDAVRDVFYAPAPCSLVRADLFTMLGGFDPGYGTVGEDLDLSWRAHLAGARVVSAPAASVAHLEATEAGQRALDGHLLSTGREHAARPLVPERAVPAPLVAEPEPWEDEPAAADPAGSHHASRRARREAERDLEHEEWSSAAEWEVEDWESRRPRGRRRRRGPGPPAATPPPAVPPPASTEALELADRRAAARLRALATNDGWFRLLAHLPSLLVLALVQAAVLLARRDRPAARRVLRPWGAVVAQSGSIRKRRAVARRARAVPDTEVVSLQSKRSVRFRDTVRPVATEGPEPIADPDRRLAVVVWCAVIAVLAFGTRHLLTGHLPTVGELAPWPALHTLAGQATSGWRLTGLGVAGPAPTAFALLAVAGVVVLGHMAVLQHLLVLGMLPLGVIGASRLARPLGSRRAQVVAVVAYLVIPLPYNALARGQWSGLVAYAAFPWIFGLLARSTGLAPFTSTDTRSSGRRAVVLLAVITALAGAVQPGIVVLVVLMGVAFLGAGVVTGSGQAGARALVLAVGAAVGATILLLPWLASWLPPTGEWAMITGVAPAAPAVHLATLLRFQTGPLGAGPLGYALLVTAALPIVIGQSWRAAWAVRLWVILVSSVALAWAGQHSALGAVWPSGNVLLAPAGVAVALAAALGMAAFDTDLPGATFGWRQVVAGVAATTAVLACIPVAFATSSGRWRQPRAGFDALLSWMPAQRAKGDFRVLWIGAPDVLPIAGWQDAPGLAYATSIGGPPDLTARWPGTSVGTTNLLGQAVELVRRGDTTAVGHLLAPMGVRYVVVVESPAPLTRSRRALRPVPADMHAGLESQLDLRLVDQSLATTVYENDAWIPMRASVDERSAAAAVATAELDDPRAARTVDLGPATAVLPTGSGSTTFRGPLPTGSAVQVAQAPSGHWQLTVGGHSVSRRPAFASANLFTVGAGGSGTLRYNTPVGWRLAYLLVAGLWVAAFVVLVRSRGEAP